VLLASAHTSAANRLITAATQAGLRRFTELDTRDFAALLRFDSDYAVTEITAQRGEWMVDKRLAELHLTQEGVLVLGINRADGSFLGTPNGETSIHVDDRVLAYGRAPVLRELATRESTKGDEAHAIAVDEQREVMRRDHPGETTQ
jgi:Trk K+ transport system NAD-binding subunit